jgi:hypothetical protein
VNSSRAPDVRAKRAAAGLAMPRSAWFLQTSLEVCWP